MMILFGEEWEYLWYIFEFVVFKVCYDYDAMIWPFYGSMNMIPEWLQNSKISLYNTVDIRKRNQDESTKVFF